MSETTGVDQQDKFRLPGNVKPRHYDLTIKSDLEKLRFEGTVVIDVEVLEPTKSITLHVLSPLEIHTASVLVSPIKSSNLVRIPGEQLSYDKKAERVTIPLPTELSKGSDAKLAFTFSGEIDDSMMGYYRSSTEASGTKENYALTQFEATAARKAFPCFDEPAIKATFGVTLVSRKGTVSLANMPVKDGQDKVKTDAVLKLPDEFGGDEVKTEVKDGEWEKSVFEKTPIVSTYLVAWANGPFKSIETTFTSPLTQKSIPIRIYATVEHIHQAQLALESTAKVLPVYEKFFDIAYPLPKLDTLIAADFDAGAMENWGLITGRTVIYLYDEKQSGLAAKKAVVGVQSHEVAHQWFGNIVTMEWWDSLWLNEAFATLMGEALVIHEVYPEWNVHADFINKHLKRALDLDAKRSSHPIEVPCPDSAKISSIFDAISYSKGGSVLKMLVNLVTQPVFLKGVSIYLKDNLYGNTRTEDLWKGISEASGKPIEKMMKNWTQVVGFPIITVEEEENEITVRQNRFLSTGDPTPEEDKTLWYVPLELRTLNEKGEAPPDHDQILEGREKKIEIKDAKNAFFKLNADTTGVYRVKYSPERLAKLGDEAAKEGSVLTLSDRMGLVQDAFVLATSGYSSTTGALNLAVRLANEKENLVWAEIAGGLSNLASVWWEETDGSVAGIDKLRAKLFGPIVDRLGFEEREGETPDDRELRALAVGVAAASGHESTLKEIQRRFEIYAKEGKDDAIPSDIRRTVFSHAIKHGGEEEWEAVLKTYRKPPTPQHKVAALYALMNAQKEELVKRSLDLVLSEEVKVQDIMYTFAGLAANKATRRRLWKFFKDNFDYFTKRFAGNFSLSRIVQYSFDSLTKAEDASEVEAFFKDKDVSLFEQSMKQGLDTVRASAAWLERDRENVKVWLEEQK